MITKALKIGDYSLRFRCPFCKRSNIVTYSIKKNTVRHQYLKYNKTEREKEVKCEVSDVQERWNEFYSGKPYSVICFCGKRFLLELVKPLEAMAARLERKRIV